jgi:hypothetical protein
VVRARALAAHKAGKLAHAKRCEDKARDWLSKAVQIEMRQRGIS